MRNNYSLIITIFVLFIQQFCFSQGYVIYQKTERAILSCGQGDIADGAVPCRNGLTGVASVKGNITGLYSTDIGNNEGCTDQSNSDRFIPVSNPEELFCGKTFNPTIDISNYCYDHEVSFVSVRPDDNFKILTPNPGIANKRTEITLEATPGYHPLVYNWQYLDINSNTWKQFPSRFLGKSSITFDAEDLFGASAEDYIDQSIQYKLELCNGWSPTGPYIYIFEYPSPGLSSIDTNPITCNYDSDGDFTINIDRNLFSNEELVITLYNSNNVLVGQEQTTSLINNGDGTFSFKWPRMLDAGSYLLKYQTHGGRGGIDPNDSSWNSLIVEPFTILDAAKVEFTITGQSEETCFDENDGYIDVEATREGNRTLYYQLIKNGTVQIFNGTKWVNYTGTNAQNETFNSFISNTTTRISKLGKGTYRVKVRDSHECYMRTN